MTDTQKIIKNYYKKLCANKLENTEVMGRLLDTYNLPILNLEDTENLNKPIIKLETESVIKTFLTKSSSGQDGFTAEFYQTFKELLL